MFMCLVSKCDTAITCFVLQSLRLNSNYTYVYSLNKLKKQLPKQRVVTELVLFKKSHVTKGLKPLLPYIGKSIQSYVLRQY